MTTNTTSITANTWATQVRGAEYKFFNAVSTALEQFQNGNSSELSKLLCFTHGKTCKSIKVVEKDRMPYAVHLKRILEHSLEGVTFKFNKDKAVGVVFTKGDNGGVNTERLAALKMFHGKTVRDKGYKETFPPKAKAAAEFDPIKWAERSKKANPEHLEAMIAALQAQRSS